MIVEREREIEAFNAAGILVVPCRPEQRRGALRCAAWYGSKAKTCSSLTSTTASGPRRVREAAAWACPGQAQRSTGSSAASANAARRRRSSPPPCRWTHRANWAFPPSAPCAPPRALRGVTIDGETQGLITYMRTDSVHLSNDALADLRGQIIRQFGADYLPGSRQPLQDQVQERPGSPRGHPPYLGSPDAGAGRAVPSAPTRPSCTA